MTELGIEILINSLKDHKEEKENIMKELLNNKKMFGVFYYELMDILSDYSIIYGNKLFYETEIAELVYSIDENILNKNFYSINNFIKFINRNIPGDFRLNDVIYCLEKHE
jgi:hypothetical protein